MSHELDELGISWADEGELRQKIAAKVTSTSCPEAMAEETAIKKAWEDLSAAEKELSSLESGDGEMSDTRREFLIHQKLTVVEGKAKVLQAAQRKAEEGRRRRMQESLVALKKEEEEGLKKRANDGNQAPAANTGPVAPHQLQPQAAPRVVAPRQPRARVLGVDPADVRPVGGESEAVREYRGGDVLPSAHKVTASAVDSSAFARVVDDGDASAFASRQTTLGQRREREDDELDDDGEQEEEFVRFGRTAQLPKSTWDRLFDYQQIAVRWMLELHEKNVGGILGDEMGLGKTIQVAAFLHLLHSSKMLTGPVLIVAPLTVLSQWISELHKWVPSLRAVMFHSSGSHKNSRESLLRSVTGIPAVVMTTYMAVTQQIELLHTANFQYVILDEGHKISNPNAGVTIAVKTFLTPHRLILSGSPIQNTLKELWCLFDFVVPGLLGNVNNFVNSFEDPIKESRNPKASPLALATAVECAKALRLHIAPYLLRRLKKDVNAMLPPKHERVIRCSLTDRQLEEYVTVLCSSAVQSLLGRRHRVRMDFGHLDRNGRAADGGLVSNYRGYMTEGMSHQGFRILSQLRLLTNHVALHKLREEDVSEGGAGKQIDFRSNNPVDYAGSGKLSALRKLLAQWKANGHKVLLFSQYRMMLDILENTVEQQQYTYVRMDGSTAPKDRAILIKAFNEDPSVFVALMTTKVGGLGVNLTGADRVVIFDPDWNPVTDEQARERAWRIGQEREVCVYRMITAGTVEEHILHRQLAKNYVTDKVLKDPSLQRFFSISSFSEAFMLGSDYADRVPTNVRHTVCTAVPSVGYEVEEELDRETREAELLPEDLHVVDHDTNAEVKNEDSNAETGVLQSLVDGAPAASHGQAAGFTGALARVSAKDTLQRAVRQ